MSAGAFVVSRYAADYSAGEIHPILVQPETIAASIGGTTNAAPTGATTSPISARATGGRRGLGLVARYVTLQAPAASPPTGYLARGKTRIPALTATFWNAATRGATCTYLGAAFTVVGRSAESAK